MRIVRCQFKVLVLILLSLSATAHGFDSDEQRMIDWIDANAEDAIALLEETVNISSGTNNHDGVRKVGQVMRRELDILGLQTEWIELPEAVNRAGHLFARKDGSGKKFLLIGHLDTVFEAAPHTFGGPLIALIEREEFKGVVGWTMPTKRNSE